MKSVRPLLPFLLLLFAFTAGAQGAYLEKGVNGMGGEARVALGLDGFEGFQIASGYSIAGILDVGVESRTIFPFVPHCCYAEVARTRTPVE